MERMINVAALIGDVLVSALLIVAGIVGATVLIHDISHPVEDSKVVWICSINGDGECGPNSPDIAVYLSNLRNW